MKYDALLHKYQTVHHVAENSCTSANYNATDI